MKNYNSIEWRLLQELKQEMNTYLMSARPASKAHIRAFYGLQALCILERDIKYELSIEDEDSDDA